MSAAVEFRVAGADDADAIADAHRDSIRGLGAAHYPPAAIEQWAGVVSSDLYVKAMARGEVFFVATAVVAGQPTVLGFSSDYVKAGATHGTSAYVRGVAARRGIGSKLLAMAEAFGIARGADAVEIEAALGAVDFYRANGFVETGRGDLALPSGFPIACVLMRKQL